MRGGGGGVNITAIKTTKFVRVDERYNNNARANEHLHSPRRSGGDHSGGGAEQKCRFVKLMLGPSNSLISGSGGNYVNFVWQHVDG